MCAENFAVRLKELREAAGLTQGSLAKLLGTGQQAVSMWEKGERLPPWPMICKLADALGVDVGEFRKKPKGKRKK